MLVVINIFDFGSSTRLLLDSAFPLFSFILLSYPCLASSTSSNPTKFTQFMVGLFTSFMNNHPGTEDNQPLLFDPLAIAYVIDRVHASRDSSYKSLFKTAIYHIEVDYKLVFFVYNLFTKQLKRTNNYI